MTETNISDAGRQESELLTSISLADEVALLKNDIRVVFNNTIEQADMAKIILALPGRIIPARAIRVFI